MKTTLPYRRGGFRAASFLFVPAALLGGAHGVSPSANAAELYTVRLSVGHSGFEPKRLAAPLGTVHFVVTSRDGDHCFAIPSLDVEKRVRASKPLEVDVTFDKVGEFPFLCCVESPGTGETGVIAVTPAK